MSQEPSDNHDNRCNRMDPFRDIRLKYSSCRKLNRALKEIGYRGFYGLNRNQLHEMSEILYIINFKMRENEKIFYQENGRMLDCCDVIAKNPSDVPSIEDGVNLLEFYNSKRNNPAMKITDYQFVVMDKHGRYYPISELFICRVP